MYFPYLLSAFSVFVSLFLSSTISFFFSFLTLSSRSVLKSSSLFRSLIRFLIEGSWCCRDLNPKCYFLYCIFILNFSVPDIMHCHFILRHQLLILLLLFRFTWYWLLQLMKQHLPLSQSYFLILKVLSLDMCSPLSGIFSIELILLQLTSANSFQPFTSFLSLLISLSESNFFFWKCYFWCLSHPLIRV